MKKILFFALILLATVSCKKDKSSDATDPTGDPRDAFVGEYNLNVDAILRVTTSNETVAALIPDSMPLNKDMDMKIEKDPNASNKVIITSDLYNCTALVSGNNLAFEGSTTGTGNVSLGDFIDMEILKNVTLPINYSIVYKTATLNNNVLKWHTDATGNGSVNVVIMTLDISGSASIENTATKK